MTLCVQILVVPLFQCFKQAKNIAFTNSLQFCLENKMISLRNKGGNFSIHFTKYAMKQVTKFIKNCIHHFIFVVVYINIKVIYTFFMHGN